MQVSRRYFFSIMTLIGILFVAFILTESAKEILGDYERNSYAIEKDSLYTRADAVMTEKSKEYVLFYGKQSSSMQNICRQWAEFRKYSFKHVSRSSDVANILASGNLPEILLVQGSLIDEGGEKALVEANKKGVNIVFCDLPNTTRIMQSNNLLNLIGIAGVENIDQELIGYHVLSGTLIGGEKYYSLENLKDYELGQMDMDLHTTWYRLSSGTKMYMTGLIDVPLKEDGQPALDANLYPPIMWRHSLGDAYVFSVNGDYMNDITGVGFLSAFMSDSREYDLYPIVNSQSIVLANVPMFTDENYDAIFSIYERSAASLLRDVLWSGISVIAIRQNANITCMVSPQLDYDDNVLPTGDLVSHFNRQIRQQNAEAGISVSQRSNVNLTNKLRQDYDFYSEYMPQYKFQSAYIEDEEPLAALGSIEAAGFDSIYSIVGDYNPKNDLLKYISSNVLYFNSTGDALNHTFSRDLMMRSVQTAIGYSMISTDLENVIYPADTEDEWQEVYDSMASNLSTYYKDYLKLKQNSLSEATQAARIFLNTEVTTSRDGNVISIDCNHDDQCYYIMRVRFEHIKKMTGGDYTKLDDNAYLITTRERHMEITMEEDNNTKYK